MDTEEKDLIAISASDYKDLIKKQGCADRITTFTDIDNFSFGFLHTQSGKRSLNDFVFCKHCVEQKEILVSIVSCKKNAKRLMEAVEKKALSLGVSKLTLHSLTEEKLKKKYESLGFELLKEIHGLNIYYMAKTLFISE